MLHGDNNMVAGKHWGKNSIFDNFKFILLLSLMVLVIGVVMLSLRLGPIVAWEWFERFMIERLHVSENTVQIIGIVIWVVSVIAILLIWLGKRRRKIMS